MTIEADTDTAATDRAATDPVEDKITLTLSGEVLAKLRQHVKFEAREDVYRFFADAVNSYVQLGQLAAGGAVFYAARSKDDDKDLVRLHFPFDPDPRKKA